MSLDFRCQIGVVGDHQRDLGVQLAGLPPPEQIDQTMALLRDHDRHASGTVGKADSPVHPMLARQWGERRIELIPAQAEALALDLHPHEKSAVGRITHMLVGAQNVPIMQGDETRDRRDQTLVIRTVDQEPNVVAHRQSNPLLILIRATGFRPRSGKRLLEQGLCGATAQVVGIVDAAREAQPSRGHGRRDRTRRHRSPARWDRPVIVLDVSGPGGHGEGAASFAARPGRCARPGRRGRVA